MDRRRLASAGAAPLGRCNWEALETRLRDILRIEHYSYSTEQTYVGWIKRFVAFHGGRKPSALEAGDVRAFLKHLAKEAQVASPTRNQAMNAVVFLYRKAEARSVSCRDPSPCGVRRDRPYWGAVGEDGKR